MAQIFFPLLFPSRHFRFLPVHHPDTTRNNDSTIGLIHQQQADFTDPMSFLIQPTTRAISYDVTTYIYHPRRTFS